MLKFEDKIVNDELVEEEVIEHSVNTVMVYSKPGCQPCKMTKRSLETMGVDFVEVDITESPADAETLIAEGYMTMPVVKLPNGDSWSGYKPELIKSLSTTFEDKSSN